LGKIAFGDNKKPPQSFSGSTYQPTQSQHRPSRYKPSHNQKPVAVVNEYRPESTVQSRPAKLASPIFNEGYTNRFKEKPERKQGEFYPINYNE
jgi:hypothetical protein